MNSIDGLVAELQLIQIWDRRYTEYEDGQPDDAYKHRQIRRREIIEKLRCATGVAPERERCRLVHDLTNKLTVILGNCEILLDIGAPGPEQPKLLHAILDAARSMTQDLRSVTCPVSSTL